MEDFWKEQKVLYKRLMKRKPLASHDTFRRVIGGLEGSVLNTLLVEVFLESAAAVANALGIPVEDLRIINIDGKELCGSRRLYGTDQEVKNLQLLNVYDQTHETCLYSRLRSVLCVEKQCVHTVTQAVSRETRYYLTSLVDLVLASAVTRSSWSVENRLHWLLDTVMAEDANHTVDRNAPRNLSMMKKMCLSL